MSRTNGIEKLTAEELIAIRKPSENRKLSKGHSGKFIATAIYFLQSKMA